MHENLLGMLVHAVRLLKVFRTRSFDRVQRLLRYILLGRLRVNNSIIGCLVEFLDLCLAL